MSAGYARWAFVENNINKISYVLAKMHQCLMRPQHIIQKNKNKTQA